jgi:hypothetical protein
MLVVRRPFQGSRANLTDAMDRIHVWQGGSGGRSTGESMAEQFTLEDLDQIYILVPRDEGGGTVNLPVSHMSNKQFREWIMAKCEIEGVSMIVPTGGISLEERRNMINRMSEAGVKIYKLGG